MMKRVSLLMFCAAVALAAYVLLDFYSQRNAPLFKRFETQWAEDVATLQSSRKLPKAWSELGEVEVIPGNPDARLWLQKIKIPSFNQKKGGRYKLEALIVPWVEEGKTGVMIQYNLVDLQSKNMIFELGRTLILAEVRSKDPIKALRQDFGW